MAFRLTKVCRAHLTSPISRPTTSRGSKSYAGRKALCTDRERSQVSFKFLPSRAQELPAFCWRPRVVRTIHFANGARATAKSTTSIIQWARVASIPTTRAQITIIATRPRLRTLAGRLMTSCASAVCLLTRSATPEIQTRFSIRVPSIIFSRNAG